MSKPKIHAFDRWLTGLSDYRAVSGVSRRGTRANLSRREMTSSTPIACTVSPDRRERGASSRDGCLNAVNATSRAKSVRLRAARRRAR